MVKEKRTEALISQLFDNQPDSVVWFYPVFKDDETSESLIDFEVQYANNAAARILGVDSSVVIGERLQSTSLMDGESVLLVFRQCKEVWTTGQSIEYTYYSPGFDKHFNVQRSRVENGVLSITRDRTNDVKAEIERREQEKIYQQILDTAADGIMYLKAVRDKNGLITDFRLTHINKKGLEVGQLPANAVGRTLLNLLPHLQNSEQFELHRKAVETGEPVRFETTFRTTKGLEYGWFIVSLTKLDDGVISNFVDVSEKKSREQQLLDQASLLNNILDASLSAVYTCEAVRDEKGVIVDLRFVQVNHRFRELSVRPGLDVIGKNLLEEFPATQQTNTMEKLARVIETGVPERFEVFYQSNGFEGWYDTSAVKMGDNGVVVNFINVTEQKKAVLEIERQKNLLDKLIRFSPSSITVIEAIRNEKGDVVDFRNILINDRSTEFSGLSKEVLLTRTNVEIDPNFYGSTAHKMLASTLETGIPCYTDYRLPTGKWIEGAASKMDNERLICITTDVTDTKEAQQRQERLLEELRRSNESLEEFTSAASHDLIEPIRKVSFFIDRLKVELQERLTAQEKHYLERIETSTARMKLLVDDLLEYSHVSREQQQMEPVDLHDKIRNILTDLELPITEKEAEVELGPLPVIKGYRRQLQQLFQNLISNSLKYQTPGVPPLISIQSRTVKGKESGFNVTDEDKNKTFHLVEVCDNGIGFEQVYAESIFHMFTRLHGNREYSGAGIGLAIARKVVDNHHGYIWANSEPGKGATFHILLPVE